MKIKGIKFMGLNDQQDPVLLLEVGLDPNGKVEVKNHSGGSLEADILRGKIYNHPIELAAMTRIAHENGIPLIFPVEGPLTLGPKDGLKYLIALLAEYERGNAYLWVDPITE